MSRSARSTSISIFAAAITALTLAPDGRADRAPAPSPTRVLEKVDATLGTQSVNFIARPRPEGDEDRTLAPYLFVGGGDSTTDRLPLKEARAEVRIAGVIAEVKLHQLFENHGQRPIEAIYVFPASTRAAVHGMRMKIGRRTVEARIERKAEARERYEQARQEGKRASLLEQQRPNVFTMNVANLVPGDRIEVELDYSELLVPEDAVYEFVLPTVVGPRYGGGADAKSDRWIANPYLPEGSAEPFKYGVAVHLETGIPIKELSSPSHKVAINYLSPSSAQVALDQPGGGNKDFILKYRLAGDRVETGLLLFQGERENFFLMMMEPPQRPADAEIPSREYIFLVDVSGSMHGFPLDTAKALMRDLLSSLRPSDYFNVVLFAGASFVMNESGSVPATRGNIDAAIEIVERQQGGGGTELMGGLKACYGIPKVRRQLSRTVVAVTDGYVGVEAQAFRFIRERLDEANLFAFGIGTAVNRELIEGMARAGQGEPFVVLRPEKAREQAEKLRTYIAAPVLANVNVRFDRFGAEEVAPQKLPDLMARRPLVLFGKYDGRASGRIEISGFTGGGTFHQTIDAGAATPRPENAALRHLWARKWIEILDDERSMSPGHADLEKAITALGLDYSLLTAFTSFVAVDSEVVNHGGRSESVAQPLPLPEGVSNLAVGHAMGKSSSGMGALGSSGSGGGYGRGTLSYPMTFKKSAAPMAFAPAPSAPPPAPAAAATARRAKSPPSMGAMGGVSLLQSRSSSLHNLLDEESPAPPQPARLITVSLQAQGLTDTAPILKAVEEVVRGLARALGGHATVLKIRLTVDKAGKVVKAEVLEGGERAFQAKLQSQLATLGSATRATGADAGTLLVAMRVMP